MTIQDYLAFMAEQGSKVAAFVLEYGRDFETHPGTYTTLPRGEPQACFANCGSIVFWNEEYTYVEGYVLCFGIPIEHAWLIDATGLVYDPTLVDGDMITQYFGVPFDREYVSKVALRTRVWGVLSYTNKHLLNGAAGVAR